jgi:DNA-binding NarL/FixJ family response regulator
MAVGCSKLHHPADASAGVGTRISCRVENENIALTPALIVEDDPTMQQRIARLLADIAIGDSEGKDAQPSIAGSLAAARDMLARQEFAIALVDIGLPDGNGCELIAWLHEHRPQTQALVISAWGHEDTVLAALRAGAIGYLLKEREDIELSLSLKSIQRGGAPIDPAIAKRILTLMAAHVPAPAAQTAPPSVQASSAHLSDREFEILKLVASGFTNREIAGLVSLSKLTIEGYTKAIYRKLAVGSRAAAVFEAKSLGLLH